MTAKRAVLLCCLTAITALHAPETPVYFTEKQDLTSNAHQQRLSSVQWNGDYTFRAGLAETVPHHRVKRVPKSDGHVINSFKHIPGKAVNVATLVVDDISTRDCAVFCIHKKCKAWSHSNATNQCRFLCAQCDYVAVPVLQPHSDYFEITPQRLGSLLFKIIFGGASGSHNIDVHESQVRTLDDPLAVENVLTDYLAPLPTSPPTDPPTPPPSPDPSTPLPGPDSPITDPPTPMPTPPPTDAPTPAPDLSYEFHFPDHCGKRPTFGLSDFERLLAPAGLERTRVIGGAPVGAGTYPWQAQIEISNNKGYEHSCGGIVISNDLILTAAHCHTKNEMDYQVRVAQNNIRNNDDPGERVLAVENVYRHSGHRPDIQQGQRNDIAMMRLKFRRGEPHGLTFSDYVQPLCLPQQNTTLVVGQECQISGWGLVDAHHPKNADSVSPLLKGAVIEILNPAICYKAYGDRFDERLMICAGREEGGVDTCSGDSGGPLSCRDSSGRWFAAGIVSFGWECGAAGHPGAYTRVSAYLEFLHRTAAFLTGVSVV